mmetsp:Transcript_8728/g.19154  ORF Transcript_8728/g.19154 Transcript_8728/m.19154 type:complete len:247 (+) Transcript_8728:937-1677(+)
MEWKRKKAPPFLKLAQGVVRRWPNAASTACTASPSAPLSTGTWCTASIVMSNGLRCAATSSERRGPLQHTPILRERRPSSSGQMPRSSSSGEEPRCRSSGANGVVTSAELSGASKLGPFPGALAAALAPALPVALPPTTGCEAPGALPASKSMTCTLSCCFARLRSMPQLAASTGEGHSKRASRSLELSWETSAVTSEGSSGCSQELIGPESTDSVIWPSAPNHVKLQQSLSSNPAWQAPSTQAVS